MLFGKLGRKWDGGGTISVASASLQFENFSNCEHTSHEIFKVCNRDGHLLNWAFSLNWVASETLGSTAPSASSTSHSLCDKRVTVTERC